MTTAYEKRNLLGFEGDEFIAKKIHELIEKFNINWAIETGTYKAGTTLRLAGMCEMVSTIEISEEFYRESSKRLADKENVTIHYGDSVSILPQLLKATLDKNILFFLDAHWNEDLPLLAELEIIAEYKKKHGNIVICIHDFMVPGRPDLGFDTYGKIKLEWSYIEASVRKIFGDKFVYTYNKDGAAGAKRGIIYITPS